MTGRPVQSKGDGERPGVLPDVRVRWSLLQQLPLLVGTQPAQHGGGAHKKGHAHAGKGHGRARIVAGRTLFGSTVVALNDILGK